MVLDFAKRMQIAGMSTFTQKQQEHPATYKSGGRRTPQRPFDLKQLSDCGGRGERQTAQNGVEEDSGEEEEEKYKDKEEDEVVEAGNQRIVVGFTEKISVDKRGRLDIYI